jgi:hypothetical protein
LPQRPREAGPAVCRTLREVAHPPRSPKGALQPCFQLSFAPQCWSSAQTVRSTTADKRGRAKWFWASQSLSRSQHIQAGARFRALKRLSAVPNRAWVRRSRRRFSLRRTRRVCVRPRAAFRIGFAPHWGRADHRRRRADQGLARLAGSTSGFTGIHRTEADHRI